MANNKKSFHLGGFYFSLISSTLFLIWFSQQSINAYWQQTYHQNSPLMVLDEYAWWRKGADLQNHANEYYQNALTFLAEKNGVWQEALGKPELKHDYLLATDVMPTDEEALIEQDDALEKLPEYDGKIVLQLEDKVLLVGDSMMQGVAPFIQKWLSQDYGIESINLSKQSTGLSYPSFFDWPAVIEKQLDEEKSIRLLVVFLGPNDPWDFPDPENKGRILKFKSEEWEAVYRSRVTRILDAAQNHGVRVIWYGVPPMKRKKLHEQMVYLNQVLEDSVQEKAHWLATWQLMSNDTEQYSDTVMLDGRAQRVRSKDGIHFTPTGQKLLADEVKPIIHIHKVQQDVEEANSSAENVEMKE